jgi:hypothetical protein
MVEREGPLFSFRFEIAARRIAGSSEMSGVG